jgi:hypothetical protein
MFGLSLTALAVGFAGGVVTTLLVPQVAKVGAWVIAKVRGA